jgi:hypothetical protein
MALAVHDGVERLLDVEEDLVLRVPDAEAAPRYWRGERRRGSLGLQSGVSRVGL